VTTLADSRTVLTRPVDFELPFDVSRQRLRRAEGPGKAAPPLSPAAVAVGRQTLLDELAAAEPSFSGSDLDTLVFLREPIARSTTAALVPEAEVESRDRIAGLVLAWIDALAPVISAARAPRRWSRVRRAEQRVRRTLVSSLADLGVHDPNGRATTLAAGIQVPIAAGAWCLTQLACRPDLRRRLHDDSGLALPFVWEILRLYPPTWLLPRISTRDYVLGGVSIPAYTPVLVSPVALGRLPELVPGPAAGCSPLAELDPDRWSQGAHRPGAWLPFGAGPHACPGRNLGLAQLTHLVTWSSGFDLSSPGPPTADTSRGLSPSPSVIGVLRQPVA
jgi:cytochrome P450